MKIGSREFKTSGKTYVMGILNVTPDSFSDGGRWSSVDAALKHAYEMIEDGADIIDVGGESTRPGHTPVNAEEELTRIIPVIEALKSSFDIPISVDTYKARVAKESIAAGADLINDIWGLKKDAEMVGVIAKSNAACCLMHNRETAMYNSFLEDVINDLRSTVDMAKKAGIADDRIILDPGVGFAKDLRQNLIITKHLEDLRELGYPVLLGTSRKSMIGLTLNTPADEREEGTIATTVMAVEKGCSFVRVHNVKANIRAVRMTEAILESD